MYTWYGLYSVESERSEIFGNGCKETVVHKQTRNLLFSLTVIFPWLSTTCQHLLYAHSVHNTEPLHAFVEICICLVLHSSCRNLTLPAELPW